MPNALPDWKTIDPALRLSLVGDMAKQGLSAGGIALRFQNATRNSVIGLCHRRKIQLHGYSSPPPPPPRKQPKSAKVKAPRLSKMPEFETGPLPEEEIGNDASHLIGLLDLTEHTCKWPVGDPLRAGFGFCGASKDSGSGPYCSEHAKRAVFQP